MNELDFRTWLTEKNVDKKVISDMISRLKKVEKEINHCDLDTEYRSDKGEYILSLFLNKGVNDGMKKISPMLPIGKYQLNTYKYAIRKYFCFLMETISDGW